MDFNPVNVLLTAIVIIFCFCVGAGVYNSIQEDKNKIDAINAGATPTQLACAFNPPHENTARLILCGEFQIKEPK